VTAGRRGAFLDRDGVLTEAHERDGVPQSPRLASDLRIYPEAPAAVKALRDAGFVVACITNQPEVARGNLDPAELERMHGKLDAEIGLDAILACPHDDADGCDCRKPKPGMLLQAADRFGLDLAASFTVGDRWRDLEAGRSAGTSIVFVDRGYAETKDIAPDAVVGDVKEASEWIIQRAQRP
jgi:D-glycero-D-manno-heptose 1,7-bisphosphate phosphatase